MCGRYALYGPQSRVREQFGVEPADLEERYNIAPSQDAQIVRCGADGNTLSAERNGKRGSTGAYRHCAFAQAGHQACGSFSVRDA